MPAVTFLEAIQKRRHRPPSKAGPMIIRNLRIGEVSLVDDPASTGARIVLSKAARPAFQDFHTAMAALAARPAAQRVQKAATPPQGAAQAPAVSRALQRPTAPPQAAPAAPVASIVADAYRLRDADTAWRIAQRVA